MNLGLGLALQKSATSIDETGLSLPVNYWIDTAGGNDSNAGTSEGAAWKSLSMMNTIPLPEGANVTVRVKAGTYDTALDWMQRSNNIAPSPVAGAIMNIVYEAGCILDGTAVNAISAKPAHAIGGEAWTCNIYGNGVIVQNYSDVGAGSPECLTTFGSATCNMRNVHAVNCDDGFSAHGLSQMFLWDCSAQNSEKSPFIHVGTSKIRAWRCVFKSSTTMSIIATAGALDSIQCYDCKWIPSADLPGGNIFQGDFYRCQIGSASNYMNIGTSSAGMGANFYDCYMRVRVNGTHRVKMTRCYGQLTTRVENGGNLEFYNCVWGDKTAAGAIVFSNFSPGSSGVVKHHSNIYKTASAADFMNINSINAGYLVAAGAEFFNNVLGGSAAVDVDLTNADTGGTVWVGNITADPLIGAANTLDPDDYGYLPGSPAIGAGVGGVNCGFAKGEVQPPAPLRGTVPTP